MPDPTESTSTRSSIILSVKKGDGSVHHLKPVKFEDAGIREVQDLEKWILAKPEVLGEPLLVLDDEYSKFEGARDRLDILCLDRQGHIVVVELKRTETAGHADLQSLRYAAMVQPYTLNDAAGILSASRQRQGNGLRVEDARGEILKFMEEGEAEIAPTELDTEPRIIIASSGFSEQVLTTADYLKKHGIDITCVSLSAYSLGEGHFVVVPETVFPVRQLQNFLRKLRTKEEAVQSANRTRAPPRLAYLFDGGQIKEGDILLLAHNLPPYAHYRDGDPMFRATVVVQNGTPKLRWEMDQKLYSPSDLASEVFKKLDPSHPEHLPVNGTICWGSSKESLTVWAQRIARAGSD